MIRLVFDGSACAARCYGADIIVPGNQRLRHQETTTASIS